MQPYQQAFVELLIRSDVLTFGDYTAKSGRRTPYFVNAGRFRTGAQVAELGAHYAAQIDATFGDELRSTGSAGGPRLVLFGPAYKGIPLVVTTSIALHQRHHRDVAFCFNRKEAKDHGEGGSLVGHTLQDGDRVVIVEDVTTAGTSIRETVPLLRAAAEVELIGLVVGVDRKERGTGSWSALDELSDEFGLQAVALVDVDELTAYLRDHEVDGRRVLTDDDLTRIAAYREEYGA